MIQREQLIEETTDKHNFALPMLRKLTDEIDILKNQWIQVQ